MKKVLIIVLALVVIGAGVTVALNFDTVSDWFGSEEITTAPEGIVTQSATITIDASAAIGSDGLPEDIRILLPEDGMILQNYELGISAGDTVRTVLDNAAQRNEIVVTSAEGGFVNGIAGLEGQAIGAESGWTFTVNGEMPMEGVGETLVSDGDVVVFTYILSFADLDW